MAALRCIIPYCITDHSLPALINSIRHQTLEPLNCRRDVIAKTFDAFKMRLASGDLPVTMYSLFYSDFYVHFVDKTKEEEEEYFVPEYSPLTNVIC